MMNTQINSYLSTDESNYLFQILANANKDYFSYRGITKETLHSVDSLGFSDTQNQFLSNELLLSSTHQKAIEPQHINTISSFSNGTNPGLTSQSGASYTSGIEALIGTNLKWNSQTISYSFMTTVPNYYPGNAEERNQFIAFNQTQQVAARRALQLYSEVSGLKFVEVSDAGAGGTIRFGTANIEHGSAHAYLPQNNSIGGDVWLNNSYSPNLTQSNGSFGFHTLIHEIGHALGLKHPGNYNAGGGGAEGPYLHSDLDSNQYTVMSYSDHPGSFANPQTPMLYDIAAIQYLYGANYNTRAGNTTYAWDASQAFVETIWDGGGIDTINASNQGISVTINLNPETFSSIGPQDNGSWYSASNNLAIASGVTIENAIGGAGNDVLIGNTVDNYLFGGSGNDYLVDNAGNDTLIGGSGNDTLIGGSGYDILTGEAGYDTFVLGDSSNVFYQGDEYARITDFNWQYDYIQVSGTSNQYSLKNGNWFGSSAQDTAIFFGNDAIAVVQDTNINFESDFLFV
ncbi:M10 family metallopeptidase C-terminal domain-containing protein [Rivularia sp. UHCC 0363]|uniref:M10 family metallopeptidase C-terminal domain-containing protein n=1 Tax=Rivularia sp. UHCC 0363 TaxID=3110244 RepID=UPI002B1FC596|nr:M10 family metallopeptidase C-terminal domain-containing protein [Rivularia sp. UHCC 0363]MEA5596759.1 M10 family metallopeptidase C-terminal domain-containing protein [Rivularia sp. UHCC 0363]